MRFVTCRGIALTAFLTLVLFSPATAQDPDPPIEWGEIDRQDLEMASFPQDTNATALVLCDFGESFINDDLNVVFRRHLRVKVLTEKGYELGTHSITVADDDHLWDIEGVTYVLNEDGDIEEHELDEDDIFSEEVTEGYKRHRFTLPGLAPGCVFEIRYEVRSESFWQMRDWVFQGHEPVRWSEYRMRYPRAIAYAIVYQGYHPFFIRDQQEYDQRVSGQALSYLGDNFASFWRMRWVVKDAPAIRDEPYVTSVDDYMTKVDVQLSGYAVRGGTPQRVLNTWSNVVKEMVESKYLGERIDVTGTVEDLALTLTKGLTKPDEKMRAVYNWVSSSIVWDGNYRVFAERDVDDVLESKKGSSAEITFVLLSLLRSVGINGDPVLISTRAHGKIQDMYPILNQFNYLLARVKLGSRQIFLDATDPLRPMDLLPERVLNVKGLVIQAGKVEWVTLTSPAKTAETSAAQIELNDDGSFTGTVTAKFEEYAGVDKRRRLKDEKDLDVAKSFFGKEASGLLLDSLSITGRDSVAAPLIMEARISASSYAQAAGDMIYLNPHIPRRMTSNPFKTIDRKFPVDYGHGIETITVTTILIPEEFEVKELPSNVSMNLDRDASYRRMTGVQGRQVQVMVRFTLKTVAFSPNQYQRLRDFYDRMVETQGEQLVLQRSTTHGK